MKKYLLDQKGMTFAEVLIAIMVIALVIIPLLASMTQSTVFSKKVDNIYTASFIAQRRIDLLKRFEFSDLYPSANETDTGVDVDNDGIDDYERTTEITENYEGDIKLLKIKVTVKRKLIDIGGARTNMGKPVVMETILFEGFDE